MSVFHYPTASPWLCVLPCLSRALPSCRERLTKPAPLRRTGLGICSLRSPQKKPLKQLLPMSLPFSHSFEPCLLFSRNRHTACQTISRRNSPILPSSTSVTYYASFPKKPRGRPHVQYGMWQPCRALQVDQPVERMPVKKRRQSEHISCVIGTGEFIIEHN